MAHKKAPTKTTTASPNKGPIDVNTLPADGSYNGQIQNDMMKLWLMLLTNQTLSKSTTTICMTAAEVKTFLKVNQDSEQPKFYLDVPKLAKSLPKLKVKHVNFAVSLLQGQANRQNFQDKANEFYQLGKQACMYGPFQCISVTDVLGAIKKGRNPTKPAK